MLYDIEDRISDLPTIVDATECDTAVLVEFTEGGPISIQIAATWPHLVKGTGIHTGEFDWRVPGISGTAVDACVILATLTTPGIILASGTVAQLTTKSGISFRKYSPDQVPKSLEGIRILQLEHRFTRTENAKTAKSIDSAVDVAGKKPCTLCRRKPPSLPPVVNSHQETSHHPRSAA